jgi:putative sigma-54 modulation protein
MRHLVDRKLARLERLLGNAIVSAQVVLTREKDRHLTEMTVHVRGDHMLNGRTHGPTWTAALTTAVEKIQRQGVKVKGKWAGRKRKSSSARSVTIPAAAATAPARNGPRVVRLTRSEFKPMSIENAAIELGASGESFLLFRNVDTDGLSVLVRRQMDEFGLVEPER